MKVIYPDKVSAVLADKQDSDYPDDNVMDEHPKKKWKATGESPNTAKLTLTVSAGSNAVAIFGTNAETVTITLKDSGGSTISSDEYDLKGVDTYLEFIQDTGDRWPSLWADYEYQDSQCTVELDFEAASGSTVEAGVVRAGLARNFPVISKGFAESLEDYSVVKELSNGAYYIKQRDVVRTFSGRISRMSEADFYSFMIDIVKSNGKSPLAWRLTDIDNHYWAVFARLADMPSGSHDSVLYRPVTFSLTEVI